MDAPSGFELLAVRGQASSACSSPTPGDVRASQSDSATEVARFDVSWHSKHYGPLNLYNKDARIPKGSHTIIKEATHFMRLQPCKPFCLVLAPNVQCQLASDSP